MLKWILPTVCRELSAKDMEGSTVVTTVRKKQGGIKHTVGYSINNSHGYITE